MALPMPSTVRLPSVLGGTSNGRLPESILVSTPGLAGGPTVRLVAVAMRAWKALTAAAAAAGHTLKATSAGDSYRTYALQESVFRARYTTTPLAGRPWKTWNGQRWYQKPNTAQAAVPGTSNHGWALAVDCGEESDGDTGTESLDAATLAWLTQHAPSFGFYWELASEPWHIRYVSGDIIPPAVLAYERGGQIGEEMPKAIQFNGYWLAQGGTRESIMDGDDMAKVNALYPGSCYPKADENGFPTPDLKTLGWTEDEVNRLLGRPYAPPPSGGSGASEDRMREIAEEEARDVVAETRLVPPTA